MASFTQTEHFLVKHRVPWIVHNQWKKRDIFTRSTCSMTPREVGCLLVSIKQFSRSDPFFYSPLIRPSLDLLEMSLDSRRPLICYTRLKHELYTRGNSCLR